MNEAEQHHQGRDAAKPHEASQALPEPHNRTDRAQTDRLERAHDRIGEALYAYLTLPDIDTKSTDLENDFYSVYRGDHATLDDVLRAQLEGLGWADDLRNFIEERAIPDKLLVWNLDLIKVQMDEIYDFVEYSGRIYLFLR